MVVVIPAEVNSSNRVLLVLSAALNLVFNRFFALKTIAARFGIFVFNVLNDLVISAILAVNEVCISFIAVSVVSILGPKSNLFADKSDKLAIAP